MEEVPGSIPGVDQMCCFCLIPSSFFLLLSVLSPLPRENISNAPFVSGGQEKQDLRFITAAKAKDIVVDQKEGPLL